MVFVSPPWAQPIEPGGLGKPAAHVALDRRTDKDSIHVAVVRRGGEQSGLRRTPGLPQLLSTDHEPRRAQPLPLDGGRPHRPRDEPDVHVEAVLVARMPRQRRPSPRRAQIANQQQFPRAARPGCGKCGEVADEHGMAVEAAPRRPHDRVAGAIERQRLGTLQATRAVETDRRRVTGKRAGDGRPVGEKLFVVGAGLRQRAGRQAGQCRGGQRAREHARDSPPFREPVAGRCARLHDSVLRRC